jgi:BASS family bile acid:Na+ symporter
MDFAKLVMLALKASIILSVFGLGLKATFADVTFLFRQPGLLLRSLLAMNVVMPLLVGVLVALSDFNPAVKTALVLLAVAPVAPILPKKQFKLAGAPESYIYGLLAAFALFAIVLVPLSVKVLGAAFGREVSMPLAAVARVVLLSILLPLLAGVLVHWLAPAFARRSEPLITGLATVLLAISAVFVLIGMWSAIAELFGNGTVIVMVIVAMSGLLVGHLLGGPDSDNRSALALACAARHPGVALAIAGINFPGNKSVATALLLNLLVSAVVSIPYMIWSSRKHHHGGISGAAAAGHG